MIRSKLRSIVPPKNFKWFLIKVVLWLIIFTSLRVLWKLDKSKNINKDNKARLASKPFPPVRQPIVTKRKVARRQGISQFIRDFQARIMDTIPRTMLPLKRRIAWFCANRIARKIVVRVLLK